MPEKSEHTTFLKCSHEGCEASYADHKWGQIQASADGWFNARDGETRYCPEHLPEWVPAWRQRKAERGE